MVDISDEQFEQLINNAMDELPQQYIERLNNVAITYDDTPTTEQRRKLELRGDQGLYGLYEGIPLTSRGASYNLVVPDKITIFKHPMLELATDIEELKHQIKHTLWHEIAHYYGLDHKRIDELDGKR